MGAIGGVLRATSGPPKYSTVSSVKNPALQGIIDSSINSLASSQAGTNTALNDFQNKWTAGEGAAAANTGQEVNSINSFYNGSMANQLAQLRTQRSKAVNDAANVASQQAIGAQNRDRVAGQGGGSSYDTRLTMANLTPIRTQAALDNSNQERQDLGYVTQGQLDLTGKRNQLNAQQNAYGLVPSQTRLQMMGQQNQVAGQLGNEDQQNKFYGLQAKPNMWADIADSLDQGVLNGVAAYSSVAGGMKRGGPVRGPGTETSDSIPVRLSKNEFVMPAEITHMTGVLPLLERIRKIALKHREERLHHGHLANPDMFKRGTHPVHGKVMEEFTNRLKKLHVSKVEHLSRGGTVRGYSEGGSIDFDGFDSPGVESSGGGGGFGGMGGGGGKKGGGGGGGGGLAGSAQQLGARAMADLTPQWQGSVMVPTGGGGPGAMTMPSSAFRPASAPQLPAIGAGGGGGGQQQSQYFQPSNYSELPTQWRQYANQEAEYYGNPKSPGYIAPGTYE